MLLCFLSPGSLNAAALNGTYTICKSGCSYATVQSAVSDLYANGVSGAVTFNLKQEDYAGPLRIIGSVTGASSKNTITFAGTSGTGSKTSRVMVKQDTALVIMKSQYVNIQNIRFSNENYPSGKGVYYALFMAANSDINISGCSFMADQTFGNPYSTYCAYLDGNENITIDKSEFHGGYSGLYAYYLGYSTISNCKMTNNYNYNLYSSQGYESTYSHNTMDSINTTTGYAAYSEYEYGMVYDGNKMYTGQYVFWVVGANIYDQSVPFKVTNNMLASYWGTGNFDLLYMQDDYNSVSKINVQILHNTFYCDGDHSTGIQLGNSGPTTGYNISNNIFIGSTLLMDAMFYTDYYFDAANGDAAYGNNFFSYGSGVYVHIAKNDYKSFADWQTGAPSFGLGQNDKNYDVTFVNPPYDLHLTTKSLLPWGPYVGVDFDIDGDKRCKTAPISGADEGLNTGGPKPKAAFTQYPNSKVTYYDGYTAIFLNSAKATDPFIYRWYVNGKFVSDSFQLETFALAAPSSTVTLVAEGCSGKDSQTVTYSVSTPTKKPVTDFISNLNTVTQGNTVNFKDLSQNYPNKWTWEIFPKTAIVNGVKINAYKYVKGDSTKGNIIVQFNAPGKYQVCLTASNKIGKGNTECKVDYIDVVGAYVLNSNITITEPSGYLYDDGGPTGPYSNMNATYTAVINPPCAKTVYLVFTDFDMYCYYDVIQVYDGTKVSSKNNISKCSGGMTGGASYPYTCGGSIPVCIPDLTDTFEGTSGALTLTFAHDYNYYNFHGFAAFFWSDVTTSAPPVASMSVADTVCTMQNVDFISTSTGANNTYKWYMQGDFRNPDDIGKEANWPFIFPGTYDVYLVVTNCGGVDTAVKKLVVKDPPKPVAAFNADNTNPTTNDIVYLIPETKVCVDDYKWTIKQAFGAAKVTFVNSTTMYSKVPAIMLSDTGCYNVTLKVSNATGVDSIVKKCHILVKRPYCVPQVGSKTPDIGIDEVNLTSTGLVPKVIMNNVSKQTGTYENYTPTVSANLEIGVTYQISVSRSTDANMAKHTVYIDWNNDGDFDDAGETVASEVNGSRIATWTDSFTIPAYAKKGATVMRLAINQGTQSNDPCFNVYGEYEDYRVYISNDQTKPVITMNGADTIRVEQGYAFTDPGATAFDNLSGNLTKRIVLSKMDIVNNRTGFDILTPSTYKFTYTVADDAGNQAIPQNRIVIVTPDKTAPDLQVNSDSTVTIGVNVAPYKYPSATASDLVDGILDSYIKVDTGNYAAVNYKVVDTYTVVYTVSDANKNISHKFITVIVADTSAPVLTLNGSSTIYMNAGTPYIEAGVKYNDNYYNASNKRPVDGMNADSWMLAHINKTGLVDVNKLGTYKISYDLCDPSKNCATQVVRTVIVQDTMAPTVTLTGGQKITVEVNTQFTDPGVVIKDNFYSKVKVDTTGDFYMSFSNGIPTKIGTYTIVYTATDSSGNSSTETRTIDVVDTQAPMVTLIGQEAVNICRWTQYKDSGISVSDNYWTGTDITIDTMGSFMKYKTDMPGIYTLYYVVTDKSGNKTTTPVRTINVKKETDFYCQSGINKDGELGKAITIYPNPSNGLFTVSTDLPTVKTARVEVTNVLGQQVSVVEQQPMGKGQFNLDLRMQAAGVYLVNIYTGNEVIVKRIVVSK